MASGSLVNAPIPVPIAPPARGVSRVASIAILVAGSLAFIVVAKHVIMPVVMALLASFLLGPVVRLLTRIHIHRPIAAALVVGSLLAIFGAALWSVSGPASEWLERLPQSLTELQHKLVVVRKPVEQMARLAQSVEEATGTSGSGSAVRVAVAHSGWPQAIASQVQSWASDLLFATILSFFILCSGEELPRRISHAFAPREASAIDSCGELGPHRTRIQQTFDESESTMSAYLITVTWIDSLLGLGVGLACWLLGMPNPVLWAVMAFILNYIPYFGAITGIAILAMAGVLSFDSLGAGLAPAGAYLGLNLLEAELLTPWALRQRFRLDPVVTLIWTALWLWLWGIPGGIFAVPLLVLGATICRNISSMRPFSELISPLPT